MARDSARGLTVRHDHGSQYMSEHFQKELVYRLRFLGHRIEAYAA
jgi:hypothetical protein